MNAHNQNNVGNGTGRYLREKEREYLKKNIDDVGGKKLQ
jgi:hypothetical protein